jgi:HD-GYP domain-containing protein (c-di-GMP phosphodiesterase class II)
MMARLLSLPPGEVEDAAMAGLLHDVGMRELDYDRLYRHRAPSAEDRRTYQQHVTVGADLLRGAGLGGVATAVRHHHERWDGGGYPDHLAGDGIPLLARIVHLAEVYDVLTSADSYRPAVSPERALGIIRSAAGQQFDPGLVPTLQRAVA